tara:strand:+ start:471 stop:839 length:369 start_codon:yes stop_codon:yes gene_type:complete
MLRQQTRAEAITATFDKHVEPRASALLTRSERCRDTPEYRTEDQRRNCGATGTTLASTTTTNTAAAPAAPAAAGGGPATAAATAAVTAATALGDECCSDGRNFSRKRPGRDRWVGCFHSSET